MRTKAEKLIRNLARRLEHDAPGVSASILEGLDEILTVTRLGLPKELRRALACTNIVENVMGTVRRVCRNVKRWRSSSMALRWTAAAMNEAKKGFRRLKAYKQLPALRAALAAHQRKTNNRRPCSKRTPLNVNLGNDRFTKFNRERDIPLTSGPSAYSGSRKSRPFCLNSAHPCGSHQRSRLAEADCSEQRSSRCRNARCCRTRGCAFEHFSYRFPGLQENRM